LTIVLTEDNLKNILIERELSFIFDVRSYPPSSAVCNPDILLTGKYFVSVSGELLNFLKGEGNIRQTYILNHVTYR